MEFYPRIALERQSECSFNSQRDGILQYGHPTEKPLESFNSQRDGILRKTSASETDVQICFNSQRDGILHCRCDEQYELSLFQFPTGWNSTSQRYRLYYEIYFVSIPNGMEFYVESFYLNIISNEFQFPTGWNSTLRLNVFMSLYSLFQFPTGWNSTSPYVW